MNNPESNFDQLITDAAERENPSTGAQEAEPDLSLGLEESRLQFQLDCLNSALKQLSDNHDLRLAYTGRIFGLVVFWLMGVVACIVLSGFSVKGFRLSDGVIIAFITSTTVNVVGLFVLVAKWMYPASSNPDSAEALEKRASNLK